MKVYNFFIFSNELMKIFISSFYPFCIILNHVPSIFFIVSFIYNLLSILLNPINIYLLLYLPFAFWVLIISLPQEKPS